MQANENAAFKIVLQGVHDFYGKELSPFAIGVWWESMRPFDLSAVRDALNRHCVNPDNGQWLPKPADVVKLIGGGTQNAALVAWAKVELACRSVGQYQSAVFDDPIIHCVIRDMGEWVKLCNTPADELPFRAKEFETRYRGYKLRGSLPEFPCSLIGLTEANNKSRGFSPDPPVMIGDKQKCLAVFRGGSSKPAITFQPLLEVLQIV